MSIQHEAMSCAGPEPGLLVSAGALGLLLAIGAVFNLPGVLDMSASTVAQCQDRVDVLASLDRSRNGVSLTCNSDMLSVSESR